MPNSIPEWILMTLLYFLPAFFADAAPVLAGQIGFLEVLARPLDGGVKLRGERILGDNKTWRGLFAGVFGGMVGGIFLGIASIFMVSFARPIYSVPLNSITFWQELPRMISWGALLGFGAIFGDALKSFFKRRLKIGAGKPWPFFDQIDYIVGAWLFSLIMFSPFEASVGFLLCALVITPPLPIVANLIAYKMGWKKVWW